MITLLVLVLSIVIGVSGIMAMIRGDLIIGLILIMLAFIVGPGGYSIIR